MDRKIKKGFIIIFLITLSFNIVACSKSLPKETKGNDSIINVKSEDEEMNLIIEQARETIDEFLKELNDPDTKGIDFAVKYPFDTDPGSKSSKEHIWIVNIERNNDKYHGIISNDPFYIKNMKMGDKVEFDVNKISDWKYVKDGFLVGGKSIVYFYNQMSEKEKKNFEKEVGFKIKSK